MKKTYEAPSAEWLAFALQEALMDNTPSGNTGEVTTDPTDPTGGLWG